MHTVSVLGFALVEAGLTHQRCLLVTKDAGHRDTS